MKMLRDLRRKTAPSFREIGAYCLKTETVVDDKILAVEMARAV